MWVIHYLHRRDARRAQYFQAKLPMATRLRIALRERKHKRHLAYLRYIVRDAQPAASVMSNLVPPRPAVHDLENLDMPHRRGGDQIGLSHERQRRAGMVNAMLAAANAERIDVPTCNAGPTRSLAECWRPLHEYSDGGDWADKHDKVPSNFFKKIGIEKPSTPRRL